MKNLLKILSLTAVLILIFVGCKKETAVTIDSVAPKITFRIQGIGNDNSFEAVGRDMSPNGEYIFKPNTKYSFTVSITDTSGLGQLIFKISKNGAVQDFILNGAPIAVETVLPSDYQYTISTLSSDPYKSFLMSGSFTTGVAGSGPDIRFSMQGRDFRPNQTNLYINGSLHGTPPTGVYGWIPF